MGDVGSDEKTHLGRRVLVLEFSKSTTDVGVCVPPHLGRLLDTHYGG